MYFRCVRQRISRQNVYSQLHNCVSANTASFAFALPLWISVLSLISKDINIFYNVYHQTLKVDVKKPIYSNAFYIDNRPTLRWMSCIQSETVGYETKCYSLLFYCWHSFDVCMIAKTTVLFICVHIQDISTVFAVSMKMPPIGFSDFNTLLLFPGLRLVLWVHAALCSLYKRPLDERGKTQLYKKKIINV